MEGTEIYLARTRCVKGAERRVNEIEKPFLRLDPLCESSSEFLLRGV